MSSGIYKIQSVSKPDRCYIGSAICFKIRWANHLNKLKRGVHHSPKLQHHYDKYGKEDLEFTVIEPCLPQFLTAREDTYFHPLPYFNICPKAGSMLGYIHSEISCKNISKGHIGQIAWNKGKKASEEAVLHQSKSHIGKTPWNKGKTGVYSEETLKLMGIANSGRVSPMKDKHYSGEALQNIRIAALNRGKNKKIA